ncbi:N-acetyltransferase eso1 [Pleurotus ostreatus]|nr:N-acetyltransferase eso1 [Pleurotus ostreatus]
MDTPLPPPPPIKWDELGHLIPIEPETTPADEKEGQSSKIPEAVKEESLPTWHDVALSIGAELMAGVREKVRTMQCVTATLSLDTGCVTATLSLDTGYDRACSYRGSPETSFLRSSPLRIESSIASRFFAMPLLPITSGQCHFKRFDSLGVSSAKRSQKNTMPAP